MRPYWRALGIVAVGVAMVGMGGCDDPQSEAAVRALGEGCLIDSDCEGELVCVFRRCHVQCETTKDCAAVGLDTDCVIGDRPTNVCLLDDEVSCGHEGAAGKIVPEHGDCPGDMRCAPDGECRDGCATASDCVEAQVCAPKGVCATEEDVVGEDALSDGAGGAGSTCIYDSACEGALVCKEGLCTEQCHADKDCPAGSTCEPSDPDDPSSYRVCSATMGSACTYNSDCVAPLVCRGGVCGEECVGDVDCLDGYTCEDGGGAHVCVAPSDQGDPAHCSDHVVSGNETDVDCGGDCDACGDDAACMVPDDCTSKHCDAMVCVAATCSDGIENGTETGTDCGGSCGPCASGVTCGVPADCSGGDLCLDGLCVPPGCTDMMQDGDETGTDCGGSCSGCGIGESCIAPSDCAELVCSGGHCAAPSCSDNIRNGDEGGIDCGGATSQCAPCGVGAPCTGGSECTSGVCGAGNTCAAPACDDGVQNGLETGLDCGGGVCPPCPAGAGCNIDADCSAGTLCDESVSQCKATHTLTVQKADGGTGTVTSMLAGLIDCGGTCVTTALDGTTITLTATPSGGSSFTGWTGASGCSANPCVVTLTSDVTAVAHFTSPITAWRKDLPGLGQPSAGSLHGLALDGAGNVFAGGFHANNCDFGGGALIPSSTADAWVAKYSATGAHVWSFTFGNVAIPSATFDVQTIAVDAGDDPILVIEADEDLRVNGALLLDCAPPNSLALVKLDGATGGAVWGKCYGTNITIGDARMDDNDDLVVVGTFTGTTSLGGAAIGPAAGSDGFIARYDGATGNFMSAVALGNGGFNSVASVAESAAGDFVVTGDCVGAVVFGNGVVTSPPGAGTDMCAVKLDSAFVAQWAYQAGGVATEAAGAADFLPSGEVIFAGAFEGQVDFGDTVIHSASTTADIAMVRLAATGVAGAGVLADATPDVSVKVYPNTGSGDARVRGLLVDTAGNIFLAGETNGTPASLDFGGGVVDEGFLVKLSSFGVHAASWDDDGGTSQNLLYRLRLGASGEPVLSNHSVSAHGAAWGGLGTSGLQQIIHLVP